MNKKRKRLQDKLRKKYGWHSSRRLSSDWSCFLYKFIKGGWVHKHPELGRATIGVDFEVGHVLGDVHIMCTEEFCETENKDFDRSIGFTMTFEELESLYFIAKDIQERRNSRNLQTLL